MIRTGQGRKTFVGLIYGTDEEAEVIGEAAEIEGRTRNNFVLTEVLRAANAIVKSRRADGRN